MNRDDLSATHANRILKSLKSMLDARAVWYALRALAKAWTTFHRLGESRTLPCRFRCKADYRMRHYVFCPPLRLVVTRATTAPAFSSDVSELPPLSETVRAHRLRQRAVAKLILNTIISNHHERSKSAGKSPTRTPLRLAADLLLGFYTHPRTASAPPVESLLVFFNVH